MGKTKQHKKLVRLAEKAELCATREEAQKLIRKAEKAHAKLEAQKLVAFDLEEVYL